MRRTIVDSTLAALTAVLGFDKLVGYELTEENTQLPAPLDVDVLINTAIQQRPDLQALTYDQQAAEKFPSRSARRDVADNQRAGNCRRDSREAGLLWRLLAQLFYFQLVRRHRREYERSYL